VWGVAIGEHGVGAFAIEVVDLEDEPGEVEGGVHPGVVAVAVEEVDDDLGVGVDAR